MNPRKITLKYMGWCPGVKSAARFIPNKDIPPIRMAMFIVLIGSTALSSFLIVQRSLVFFGIPSATTVNVDNVKPRLIVVGDDLFLATDVRIGLGSDISSKGVVYLLNLAADGRILDTNVILDQGSAHIADMDLIVTSDGKWHMVYQQYRTGGFYYLGNDLKYIHSDDGKNWEKPVVVTKGGYDSPHFDDISLTEIDNGEIFLCYRKWNKDIENYTVFSSKYTSKYDWEPREETPFHFDGVSSFLDKDDVISIVGVQYPDESHEGIGGGPYPSDIWSRIYLSKMTEEGVWTKPSEIYLGSGIRAQIYYSRVRDGYFIVVNGWYGDEWVQVSFSKDLKDWGIPITFGYAKLPAFAELSNGTLVLVFERRFESPRDTFYGRIWTELFVSTSRDGLNWSTPQKVETIVYERGLESILSFRRSVASAFVSIPASVLVILFLYKKPGLILGESLGRSNSSELES